MQIENDILSDIVVFSKYARFMKDFGRRETWEEICWRNCDMHQRRYPELKDEIRKVYADYVLTKKVLPSMRSMQFGGRAIERNPARIYNCAYLPVEHPDAFSETMFLLLGGTGVGYSVQSRHVNKLPSVLGPRERTRRYVIGDSIEGWSDAVKVLVEAYFYSKAQPVFDYGDIRDKGTELVTSGGKAPGPDPLRVCLAQVEGILHKAIGRRLSPLEAHDIQCFLADAVLAGGIRRAAMIALFSSDDNEMMECKSGNWWELHPERSRANNSVVLLRSSTTNEEFVRVWERVRSSGAGEPGIYWTNNLDWGTNPCCEIALRPYQFCNLNELNGSTIEGKEDFLTRCRVGAFIGTLQAGYTDFHYLRPIWKQTTEEDALIGVGVTGIAAGKINEDWLTRAADVVKAENFYVAEDIGINQAARTTTVKPSGTTSIVLGSSSGVHAYHNDFYIRRMRFGKDEAIWKYLSKKLPEFCEDEKFRPNTMGVFSMPQRSPQGAVVRTEPPLELLERVRLYNDLWVKEGHVYGDNRNNVSCTISLKDEDWGGVGEWMWEYRNSYNGISVLPYDGGSYIQAPFEDISEEQYHKLLDQVRVIDLSEINENEDNTNLAGELACVGGACEVPD
jgi:ribonucleoside-diphosphate reductase alpha chain